MRFFNFNEKKPYSLNFLSFDKKLKNFDLFKNLYGKNCRFHLTNVGEYSLSGS